MRGTALLLAAVLAGCTAGGDPNAPPQAADWRYRDGGPVSARAFAELSQACEQQAAVESRPIARTPRTLNTIDLQVTDPAIPPAPYEGVIVPGMAGTSLPPPRGRLVDQCLEAQGLMPAH